CIVGALRLSCPVDVAVKLNQTDAKYGPGHGPCDPLQSVGSVADSVASAELNSTGMSSVRALAPPTRSLLGGAATAGWASVASSARDIASAPAQRPNRRAGRPRDSVVIPIPSIPRWTRDIGRQLDSIGREPDPLPRATPFAVVFATLPP